MLTFLPGTLLGVLSITILSLNTLVAVVLIYLLAIIKLLAPFSGARDLISRMLEKIAETWVLINNITIGINTSTKWDVTGIESLKKDNWYIVISNHQSQLDIVVLQKIFHGKIPFLKFFIKKELLWAPLFGFAWWALDFPFMKRYSSEFIKKNPHMKGKDLEATRKACEKFRKKPTSIVNYVEGTRFTQSKHDSQGSPYKNLLRPRAGGVGFVISSMGDLIQYILDVTILYPDKKNSIWDFVCNRISEIKVKVDLIPLEGKLLGDYVNDENYKESFQDWLNKLWEKKDNLIKP